MVNYCQDILHKIRYTQPEIKWRENVHDIGTGDIRRSKTLTIYDELKELADIIANDNDITKIDRMYQIRYVIIDGQYWVVDSNRKLFIALKIEKLFGLLFACTDVTNTYVTPLDKLEDIADMIQRHEQGVIFLPTFQPYIIYQDRTERVIGQRSLRNLYRQYRPKNWSFFPDWFNLENAWMVFPIYVIFLTTVLTIVAMVYMVMEDLEAIDSTTAGTNVSNDEKIEL